MTNVKANTVSEGEGAADEPRRGRGRPQQRSDEETRAVVTAAARHEFSHSGYAATGMENVARRAGVSTKTVYRLFPNKAALFEAMVSERIETFESIVKLRACDGSDVETALSDALQICADLMLAGDVIALQRVILADSDKLPDIAETFFQKAITPTQNALANWLRTQKKRGTIELDNADAAAGMLLGMLAMQPMRSVMFGHRPPPSPEERAERARTCAKLFLRGCRRR